MLLPFPLPPTGLTRSSTLLIGLISGGYQFSPSRTTHPHKPPTWLNPPTAPPRDR
jgi:hypothetical protein